MITYIIKSGKYYTIGRTKNLEERLKTYRTHNPDFEIMRVFDGDYERSLHEHFKEYRIDRREWFILSKNQIDVIDINKFNQQVWPLDNEEYIDNYNSQILAFCVACFYINLIDIALYVKENMNKLYFKVYIGDKLMIVPKQDDRIIEVIQLELKIDKKF